MGHLRLLLSLITLIALTYGVFQVKVFLSKNFIDNDTKLKFELNQFLNGKTQTPKKL